MNRTIIAIRTTIIAAIFLVSGENGYPNAQQPDHFVDAGTIYKECKEAAKSSKSGKINKGCSAYLMGVIDSHIWDGQLLGDDIYQAITRYCIPQEATIGDIAQIFVLWMQAHPKEANQQAAAEIAISLGNAYPCHKE